LEPVAGVRRLKPPDSNHQEFAMPKKVKSDHCGAQAPATPRRIHGPEAVVFIVIITLAAVLVPCEGLQAVDVLQLLAGAGLVAVLVIGLAAGAARGLRAALRAMLTSGPAA
jgi:hypothetical protein